MRGMHHAGETYTPCFSIDSIPPEPTKDLYFIENGDFDSLNTIFVTCYHNQLLLVRQVFRIGSASGHHAEAPRRLLKSEDCRSGFDGSFSFSYCLGSSPPGDLSVASGFGDVLCSVYLRGHRWECIRKLVSIGDIGGK